MANQHIETANLDKVRQLTAGTTAAVSPLPRGLRGRDLYADNGPKSAAPVRDSGHAPAAQSGKKGKGGRIGTILAISLAAACEYNYGNDQDAGMDATPDSVSDVATPDSSTDAAPDSVPDATPDSLPDVTPDLVPDTDSRDARDSDARTDDAGPTCAGPRPPDTCASTPTFVECSLQEGTDIDFDGIRFTPATLEGSDIEITSLNLYTGCVGSFGSAVVQPGGFSYIFTPTTAYKISMDAEGTTIRIDKRPLSACSFERTRELHPGDPLFSEDRNVFAVLDAAPWVEPRRAEVSVVCTGTGETRSVELRSNCAVGIRYDGTNYLLRTGVVDSYTPLTFAVCE